MSDKKATAVAADTKAVPEIKQETRDLAAKLNVTIDPKTGLATLPADAYVATLPEEITPAIIKAVHQHNTTFLAGLKLATGEAGLPVMKKHSDLAKIEVEALDPAGNKFSVVVERSKLSGPPGGEKTEKFGATSASIELRAARKTGQLGAVKSHLTTMYTKALASK